MQALFASPDTPPTLDLVAGTIALLASPPADVEAIVAQLDELAADSPELDSATDLLLYLHGEKGFRGNQANYYEPENSFLHVVLERRLGIPITLATVAIEVGRRVGIPLHPIGFPGHLLLADGAGSENEGTAETFYDPFRGGPSLSLEDCRQLLQGMFPGASLEDDHTRALPVEHVGQRMLNNLKQIFLSAGNLAAVVDVACIGVAIPGADVAQFAELTKLFEVTGRNDQAADLHDHLATLDTEHGDEHRLAANRLRFSRN